MIIMNRQRQQGKRNTAKLATSFTKFLSKCLRVNEEYVKKHFELIHVFSAFKALHYRFANIHALVDNNLEDITKMIAEAKPDLIDTDHLNELIAQQAEIAQQASILDQKMSNVAQKYSKENTRNNPLFFDALHERLLNHVPEYTGHESISKIATAYARLEELPNETMDAKGDVEATKSREVYEKMTDLVGRLSGASPADALKALMKHTVTLSGGGDSSGEGAATEKLLPFSTMISSYVSSQRLVNLFLQTDTRLRDSHLLPIVPHLMAMHSYGLRPTLIGTGKLLSSAEFYDTGAVEDEEGGMLLMRDSAASRSTPSEPPVRMRTASRIGAPPEDYKHHRLCLTFRMRAVPEVVEDFLDGLIAECKDHTGTHYLTGSTIFERGGDRGGDSGGGYQIVLHIPIKYRIHDYPLDRYASEIEGASDIVEAARAEREQRAAARAAARAEAAERRGSQAMAEEEEETEPAEPERVRHAQTLLALAQGTYLYPTDSRITLPLAGIIGHILKIYDAAAAAAEQRGQIEFKPMQLGLYSFNKGQGRTSTTNIRIQQSSCLTVFGMTALRQFAYTFGTPEQFDLQIQTFAMTDTQSIASDAPLTFLHDRVPKILGLTLTMYIHNPLDRIVRVLHAIYVVCIRRLITASNEAKEIILEMGRQLLPSVRVVARSGSRTITSESELRELFQSGDINRGKFDELQSKLREQIGSTPLPIAYEYLARILLYDVNESGCIDNARQVRDE